MVDTPMDNLGESVGRNAVYGVYDLVTLKLTLNSIIILFLLLCVVAIVTQSYWQPIIRRNKPTDTQKRGLFFDDPAKNKRANDAVFLGICVIFAIGIWLYANLIY